MYRSRQQYSLALPISLTLCKPLPFSMLTCLVCYPVVVSVKAVVAARACGRSCSGGPQEKSIEHRSCVLLVRMPRCRRNIQSDVAASLVLRQEGYPGKLLPATMSARACRPSCILYNSPQYAALYSYPCYALPSTAVGAVHTVARRSEVVVEVWWRSRC